MGRNWWEIPTDRKDYGRGKIPHLSDPRLEDINFAKRAILSADIINTVSEQYREEIMTKKFGQDLQRILRNREDRLFGIINGIDHNTYNPEKDDSLYRQYTPEQLELKLENKKYLQQKIGLPVADVPILCTTSRVTFQKGFNLILGIIEHLLKLNIQIIFLGDGNEEYIKPLKKIQRKYQDKTIWLPFDQNKESLLYAAADLFLLPSNHEPCGINQLIAMRYGCIPIVRAVGGLRDTVENFNPSTGRGTGFTFKTEDEFLFYAAIIRALENYKHKKVWRNLVRRAMSQSTSWQIPAKKYVNLYRRALRSKKV